MRCMRAVWRDALIRSCRTRSHCVAVFNSDKVWRDGHMSESAHAGGWASRPSAHARSSCSGLRSRRSDGATMPRSRRWRGVGRPTRERSPCCQAVGATGRQQSHSTRGCCEWAEAGGCHSRTAQRRVRAASGAASLLRPPGASCHSWRLQSPAARARAGSWCSRSRDCCSGWSPARRCSDASARGCARR